MSFTVEEFRNYTPEQMLEVFKSLPRAYAENLIYLYSEISDSENWIRFENNENGNNPYGVISDIAKQVVDQAKLEHTLDVSTKTPKYYLEKNLDKSLKVATSDAAYLLRTLCDSVLEVYDVENKNAEGEVECFTALTNYDENGFSERFFEAVQSYAKEIYPDAERPYDSLLQTQRCIKADFEVAKEAAEKEGYSTIKDPIEKNRVYLSSLKQFWGNSKNFSVDWTQKTVNTLRRTNSKQVAQDYVREEFIYGLQSFGAVGLFSKKVPVFDTYIKDVNFAIRECQRIWENEMPMSVKLGYDWPQFDEDRQTVDESIYKEEPVSPTLNEDQIVDYSAQYAETLRQAGWSEEQIDDALASFNSKLTGNPENDDEHTNN